MAKIHIVGMGVVGSLLAIKLEDEGIDFTWSDIDAPFTAWKASTGAVQPMGTLEEMEALQWWVAATGHPLLSQVTEIAQYCYSAKKPPHEGDKIGVRAVQRVGNLKISNMPSVHINPQRLVKGVRKRFVERVERPAKSQTLILSHGFGPLTERYSWGWSTVVDVELSPELQSALPTNRRGCFYLRKGYQMAYIYPRPGTPYYYAGSSYITQARPKEFSVDKKFTKWMTQIVSESSGHVIPIATPTTLQFRQGWRPKGAKDLPLVQKQGRMVYIKPQEGNGFRHFPMVLDQVLELI